MNIRPYVRALLAFGLTIAAIIGHLSLLGVDASDMGPVDALAGAAVTFYFTSE
jgi:hypothetical protein